MGNFGQCYMAPGFTVSQNLPKLDPKSKPVVEYAFTFVGQHDIPWLLMSLFVAHSGVVSKEYMMASVGNWLWVTADIAFRVYRRNEEFGGDKKTVLPYIPFCAVIGILNIMAYRAM